MIRAVVVLISIVVAAAAGVVAALWGSPRLAGLVALGLIPVVWRFVSLMEWSIGGTLWDFAAPYPYGSDQGRAIEPGPLVLSTSSGEPANHESSGVRGLSEPDDPGGWHSSLDDHVDDAPVPRFGRDRGQ